MKFALSPLVTGARPWDSTDAILATAAFPKGDQNTLTGAKKIEWKFNIFVSDHPFQGLNGTFVQSPLPAENELSPIMAEKRHAYDKRRKKQKIPPPLPGSFQQQIGI